RALCCPENDGRRGPPRATGRGAPVAHLGHGVLAGDARKPAQRLAGQCTPRVQAALARKRSDDATRSAQPRARLHADRAIHRAGAARADGFGALRLALPRGHELGSRRGEGTADERDAPYRGLPPAHAYLTASAALPEGPREAAVFRR